MANPFLAEVMFELFFFTPNQNIHEEDIDDGENESHCRSKEQRRSKKDENIPAEIERVSRKAIRA